MNSDEVRALLIRKTMRRIKPLVGLFLMAAIAFTYFRMIQSDNVPENVQVDPEINTTQAN